MVIIIILYLFIIVNYLKVNSFPIFHIISREKRPNLKTPRIFSRQHVTDNDTEKQGIRTVAIFQDYWSFVTKKKRLVEFFNHF